MDSLTQDELIDIARNDSDWNVRLNAVEKITDQDALKDIFKTDSMLMVKIKAVSGIADTDFLSDECLNCPQAHIRHAILNRIIDEGLFKGDTLNSLLLNLTLNDPEDMIAQIACRNLSDDFQAVFSYIAKSHRDDSIRLEAVSKVKDENLLKDIALNDDNRFIRLEAILNENLTSLDTLEDIILSDEDEFNRYSAISKIPDEDALAEIIFDERLYPRLSEISKNITYSLDDYFFSLLDDSADEYTWIVAVNFIQNSHVLKSIILNCKNHRIIADAIRNPYFKDTDILPDLFLNDSHFDVISAAAERCDDENLIIEYLKRNLSSDELTFDLISKITDRDFLECLYCHENTQISSHVARQLIRLKYHLPTIAMNCPVKEIQMEAVGQIKDKYDLAYIAHECEDSDIALSALDNIVSDKLIEKYLPHKSVITDSLNEIVFRRQIDDLILNDDKEIRKLAVMKLNRKEKLDEIINSSGDIELADAARRRLDSLWQDIKMIDNEKVLHFIADKGDDEIKSAVKAQLEDLKTWRSRISKINDISDISKLKDIANNDYNYYVRCEAEGRLENLLFDVRIDELMNGQNQEKFKRIADDDTYPSEIRKKAFLMSYDENYNYEGLKDKMEIQKLLLENAKSTD